MINKIRNSNLELLRIICMILIVFHHYYVHSGIIEVDTINSFIISLLGFGGRLGCNIYIIITGYFMIEKEVNIKKIVKLFIEMSFYSLSIMFIIYGFNLEKFDLLKTIKEIFSSFYGNWFIICYTQLYLFIPYINKLLNNLTKKTHLELIVLIFLLYSTIPTIIPSSSWELNTLFYFIFMYVIGAYFKLYKPNILSNRKLCFKWMIFNTFIVYILMLIYYVFKLNASETYLSVLHIDLTSMYNMFIITIAIFAFGWFNNLNIKNKVINYIASSTLGIYLIHDNVLMRNTLWDVISPNINYLNTNFFILHMIIKCIIIFVLCLFVDKLRVLLFDKVENSISNKIVESISKIKRRILLKINESSE